MLDMSKVLKFEMMSLMKLDSWLLFGVKISFDIWTISSDKEIMTVRGVWSEDKRDSRRIEC